MAVTGEWRSEAPSSSGNASRRLLVGAAFMLLLPIAQHAAHAATEAKSGKEVV